ncbi:MAG: DoxX family protein [Deltaproteobacteria bacterium]|nr:DoxX family protein [Deltaproteobacteria bacterium]
MMKLLATDDSRTLMLQRLVLGAVMFPHGAQKLLGWFGGYGWSGTMGFFTHGMGLPAALGGLIILIEFFGSLALLTGTLSRFAALGVAAVMVGAVVTTHLSNGFFMNWGGKAAGEGFEYHLLALALALPLVVRGGGAYSVDRTICEHRGALTPHAA